MIFLVKASEEFAVGLMVRMCEIHCVHASYSEIKGNKSTSQMFPSFIVGKSL